MTELVSMIASEESIKRTNGPGLFLRSWKPMGSARAIVVVVDGFNAHSGHYEWVAEQLTSRGLAVYPLDLRGRREIRRRTLLC
jgi:alpha-beta hydrolase superfamily lysophospholipase